MTSRLSFTHLILGLGAPKTRQRRVIMEVTTADVTGSGFSVIVGGKARKIQKPLELEKWLHK